MVKAWWCRIVGHNWFGRRSRRELAWIGDNTGHIRQTTTCSRCSQTRELAY